MNPIEHGLAASYDRCRKLLGEACNRCKRARADYLKEWRKKNGEPAKLAKAKANARQKAKTVLAQRYAAEYRELVIKFEKEVGFEELKKPSKEPIEFDFGIYKEKPIRKKPTTYAEIKQIENQKK